MEMEMSGMGTVLSEYNSSSGLMESQAQYYMGSLNMYAKRATSFPDWPVGIGDRIYWKQNMMDDQSEVRFTITEINGYLENMTEVAENLNMMGISFVLPPGQPELQFFMRVYAMIDFWDYNSSTWVPGIIIPFASANEYWPIAVFDPMSMVTPVIMPKGTVASDFQILFDMMMGSMFNDIDYSFDHITLRNTTVNREMHFYFDGAEGKAIYIGGDNYMMGNWVYISMYPEFARALNTGPNTFSLLNDLPVETSVSISLNTTTSGADCIYAVLPLNPLGHPLPKGTELIYLDMKITDTLLIVGNITMTFTLPSTIDLSSTDIYFWAWNVSGLSQWDEPPPEFVTITYDYNTNSITFEYPVPTPYAIISAISYESSPFIGQPQIPGYDSYLIALLIIIVSAVLIKRRRKYLSKFKF
jgi:hypothetical protein